MKKLGLILIGFLFFIYGGILIAKKIWRGELISIERVCDRWGNSVFKSEKFKAGDEVIRASMTCSLLKQKKEFVGLHHSEIRKRLGDYTGFYFSDIYPTYMIEIGKSHMEDSWQIVFFVDRHGRIEDIAVHKNCCDR